MQDVRLAIRNLLKRPGFFAVAVVTLALGIGANTAVFTVFNAILLAPLPYDRPDEVVMLQEQTPQFPGVSVTRYNFDDWRTRAKSFTGMAAFRPTNVTVTGAGDPERVPAKMITPDLLPLLGVTLEHGRGFGAADDRPGAEGVALVSAGFARRKYQGEAAVGRTLQIDNMPYTVVGIVPPRFELFLPADVYLPFGPWAATLPDDRGWHPGIYPMARLREGVSIEDARVEMDAIARDLEMQQPEMNRNVRVMITRANDLLVQNIRPALRMLLGAVTLVLLIACANVANLLLARAVGRQKEIAVRVALGAGRARIVRQLLVESVVLACIGGLAGVLVAAWGVSFFTGATVAGLPRAQNIAIAWPVAIFTAGLSIVTGLVFGLVPAIQAMRFDVRRSLNEEGRSGAGTIEHRRARATLVVVEVGLALVLLVGAGLLLRSFATLTAVSPGFNPDKLLVVNLPLSPLRYQDNTARNAAVDRILERLRQLPGVQSAAMTTALPMAGPGPSVHFNRAAFPPKGPDDYVMAGLRAVTPEYLSTLGVPLSRGRMLTPHDRDGAQAVVVINEAMAHQFFPDMDPIGQLVQLGTEPSEVPTMEVVGVVGDMKQSFATGSKAEMFMPYTQFAHPVLGGLYLSVALVVRTTGDPLNIAGAVRSIVRETDPHQPLVNVRTMETSIAGTVAQPRLQMLLLVIFAGVAVALAVIGVYGVMAYTVTQRIPEIGVRMAVGASPNRVIAMVVWQGAQLALVGLGLGLVAAVFAARAVESLLFDVTGLDPLTFSIAPIVLVVAALLATYIPASKAARISPLAALGRVSR
jgi:putative ABC transport system permease protein